MGLNKLPGDFSFTLRGRECCVPLTSSVVLTVLTVLMGVQI